jgi:hypothetical protein
MASTNVVPSPGRLKTLSATINLAGEHERHLILALSSHLRGPASLISHPQIPPLAKGLTTVWAPLPSSHAARWPMTNTPRPLALLSRGPWVGRVPGRVTLPVKRELASCDDTRLHSLYRFDTGLAAAAAAAAAGI